MVDAEGSDSTDKRESLRVPVSHAAEFRVTGSEALEAGRLKDISAGGFLFSVERPLEPGTALSVTLRSASSELVTAAWVIRCARSCRADDYEVACAFD